MQSKCAECGIKKLRFAKEQEAKVSLSNSGIKTPLDKVPMNEIVNRFLLAGHKFMPEMHLKQPGFTYNACAPYIKNKEETEKFMQTGNTDLFTEINLVKLVFNMIWLMVNQKI